MPEFTPKTPQKPSSHANPASHPSFPQTIRHSRGRGNPEKKQSTPSPPTTSNHRRTLSHNNHLTIQRATPTTQQPSPLPRAIPLPLPRGRLRGGPRVRATRRPWGAAPPKQPTPSLTENTLDNTPLIPHILVNHPPFAPRRGTRAQRAGGCPKFTAAPTPLSLRPTRRGGSRTAPTTTTVAQSTAAPSQPTMCPLSRSAGEG